MVDCPVCGYGKNIPEEQKKCPVCGADLTPLHRLKALPQFYYAEGVKLTEQGLTDKAIEKFTGAIAIDANFTEAYLALANVYLQKGLHDDAISCIEKALEISPDNEDAKTQKQKALSLKDAQIKKGRLRKQFAIAGFGTTFVAGMIVAFFSNGIFNTKTAAISKDGKTGIIYTVQKGDSLSKIAKEKYGNILLWQKIYETNKDKIKDPNKLPAGVTIVLEDILMQPK